MYMRANSDKNTPEKHKTDNCVMAEMYVAMHFDTHFITTRKYYSTILLADISMDKRF